MTVDVARTLAFLCNLWVWCWQTLRSELRVELNRLIEKKIEQRKQDTKIIEKIEMKLERGTASFVANECLSHVERAVNLLKLRRMGQFGP